MVEHAITPSRPRLGGAVAVTTRLVNRSRQSQRVVADLIVHFVKANGRTHPKVFTLATLALAPGESATLGKTVSLAHLATRTHYPGPHRVALQLNGVVQPLGTFALVR